MSAAVDFVKAHLLAGRSAVRIAAPEAYRSVLVGISGVTSDMLTGPDIERPGQVVVTDTHGNEWAAVLPGELP